MVNSKKEEVTFESLFAEQKTIVVFIRHFFCGSCQEFVKALTNSVTQDALEKAGTRIVIIGCGGTEPIGHYQEVTGFQGEIYTNPARDIYFALGMTKQTTSGTPSNETRKDYLITSKFNNWTSSAW